MTALILLGIAILIIIVASPEFKRLIFGRRNARGRNIKVEKRSGKQSQTFTDKFVSKVDQKAVIEQTDPILTVPAPEINIELANIEKPDIVLNRLVTTNHVVDTNKGTETIQNASPKSGVSTLDTVNSNRQPEEGVLANKLLDNFKESGADVRPFEIYPLRGNSEGDLQHEIEIAKDMVNELKYSITSKNDEGIEKNSMTEREINMKADDKLCETKEIRSPIGGVYQVNLKKTDYTEIEASHAEEEQKSGEVMSDSKPDDPSVIDVSRERYKIPLNNAPLISSGMYIPEFKNAQIYDGCNIKNASISQQYYFIYFKRQFLKGSYLELEGNFNYAFALMYDFLNDYNKNENISLLEAMLNQLALSYPVTIPYCKSAIAKLKEPISIISKPIVYPVVRQEVNFNDHFEYQEYKLGDLFKEKLHLKEEDVQLLNKIGFYGNTFTEIEFCYLRLAEVYLNLIHALSAFFLDNGASIDGEFGAVADIIVKKSYNYRSGSDNYKYAYDVAMRQFYFYLMKNCENSLRECYGVKRKLNANPEYAPKEVALIYSEKIEKPALKLLPAIINNVAPPDDNSELLLNAQNTTRWKNQFNIATGKFDDIESFVKFVDNLGSLNKDNPSIENIFYEASKFSAVHNKRVSLRYYITYIYYDLNSVTFNNKPLTKSIQKCLFETDEQIELFKNIIGELVKNKDLPMALSACDDFYTVKRRKIKLDKKIIQEVVKEDANTTDLLNKFLQDDDKTLTSIETKEIGNSELEVKVEVGSGPILSSIYKAELKLHPIQIQTLDLFKKENLEVSSEQMDTFAKSNGRFGGQIVESINESCFELLDDNLIEQQEELYIIDNDYFKCLLAC